MDKSLVIVESPAKVKTINKFLGERFEVCSSMGHIMDLPKKSMGIDIENDFKPTYVIIPSKRKTVRLIKKEAEDKTKIYIATDSDREGEAISWHLKNILSNGRAIYRVTFNEITKDIVKAAFKNPGDIDKDKVNAQTARRVLDRIVGYSLSPLLWKKVGRGLSAGRVQSIALRLIVEREKKIKRFQSQEYWEVEAELKKQVENGESSFKAKLEKINDKKCEIKNKQEAENIVNELKNGRFLVTKIEIKEQKRYPQSPFTTSKLQQEAFNSYRFSAQKTMQIAQQLYEGLNIGGGETTGLITYMRTDSVRVSTSTVNQAREFIVKDFGKDYLPENPQIYKSKKSAQEAHEAIRPTDIERKPDKIKEFVTSDQYKLYKLIWNKFLASQMKPAVHLSTIVVIKAEPEEESRTSSSARVFLFKTRGLNLLFPGFLSLYEYEKEKDRYQTLPRLEEKELLLLLNLIPSQHFTKPPARYSDGSLVKSLEACGVGRPSTYAPTIRNIIERDYIRKEKGYLYPTELGIVVCELLIQHFPRILNVKFTAEMENELDNIEEGKMDWVKVIEGFYLPFKQNLDQAMKDMENIKKKVISTSENCPECEKVMIIKWGRRGRFLSCSGFPDCKFAKPISTGIKCPTNGCSGLLVERRSKSGRTFYGCSNYPKCRYITNKLPDNEE